MAQLTVFIEHPQASVVLVTPQDDEAREWLQEHTDPEATWLGPSLGVEARYAQDLLLGAIADGVNVKVCR